MHRHLYVGSLVKLFLRSAVVAVLGLSVGCSGTAYHGADAAWDSSLISDATVSLDASAQGSEDARPPAQDGEIQDAAAPVCGNGVMEAGEACDDGAQNSNMEPDACRLDCSLPSCGDGVRDLSAGEACDDGNVQDGDDCSSDCSVYTHFESLGISGVNYDLGRDNTGDVHLLWKVGGTLQYGQIVSGAVVGQEEIPNSTLVNTRYNRPRIAVRPDGNAVHTAWNGAPGETIQHAWRDAGGTWHRETAWQNGGGTDYMASTAIGVDLTGAVHVVAQHWTEGVQGSPVVALRKPAGGVWSSPVEVQAPGNRQWRDTALFVDGQGGIHATWKDGNRPGKYRSVASGGDLGAASTVEIPVPPDPSINSVGMGDLFVTASGDVHAVFLTYSPLEVWTEVRRGDTGPFGEASRVSVLNNDETLGYENPWPAIVVDSHDRVFVSWAENRGTAAISYVVLGVFDGVSWTVHDVTTTAALDPTSGPAMTVVGDLVYLLYRDTGGTLTLVTMRYGPP